ncbi:MAG: D-alanyl-D-alanine carboxypeptidase/D-alanyl-D-alanine-endopeptidase [Candidatus Sumerlaeia bacterium]|nr:D-alanyl-D-alanine carboxypeptidase/D-alanyl-D-alanine-endopeptidase [Candidatus Sumerlaeia bacterium]
MPVRHAWISLLLLILVFAASAFAAPLDDELRRLVSSGASARAHWGIYAIDAESGRVLADINGDRLFVPASTRKLVSTAMALEYLGGSRVLETHIHAPTPPAGDTIRGDLVVRAVGDPSWTPGLRGGRPGTALLRQAARDVAARGVTRIEGDLVVDASRFRRPALIPEGWEWSDFQTSDGPIPAVLSFDRNLASVRIEPAQPGQPVRIAFDSLTNPFELTNRSVTGARDSAPTFVLTRGLDGIHLEATGSLAANTALGRRAMPVGRPVDFTAAEFAALLAAEGVRLAGSVRISTDSVPLGEILATVRSAPIAEIATVANRDSDNFLAESLYLLAGAELYSRGSYQSSLEAERRFWRTVGADPADWVAADGSGLSRRNLVTPRAYVQLLQHSRRNPIFVDTLAVSGRSGTLRYRLSESGMAGRVQAKTGTLTGVAGLAGTVRTSSGRTVLFAVLANNFASSPTPIRRDIDRVVERLAAQ